MPTVRTVMDLEFQRLRPIIQTFKDALRQGNNDKILAHLTAKGHTTKSILTTIQALRNLEMRAKESTSKGLLPEFDGN